MNDTLLRKKYGPVVEHAGTGLYLPEKLARQVDELSRGLPKDFGYRRVAKAGVPSEMKLDGSERTDVSFITTDAVDRDGEVVIPAGIDWSKYNKVVTFAHDYKTLPVGSNQWIKPMQTASGAGLLGKTYYPTSPPDWQGPWMPDAILHLMGGPVPTCTGKSIGFLTLNIRTATREEKAMRPEWDGRPIIDKAVGIEYAVAPVPCNADAEMVAVTKGIEDESTRQLIADALVKLAGKRIATEPAVAFVRPETIRKYLSQRCAAIMGDLPARMDRAIQDAIDRHCGRV